MFTVASALDEASAALVACTVTGPDGGRIAGEV
jgi:hypothetical protein